MRRGQLGSGNVTRNGRLGGGAGCRRQFGVPEKRKLSIDGLLKLGLGLNSVDKDSVDEESGCAAHASFDASLPVRIDAILEFSAGQASLKRLFLQAEPCGARDQIGILQLALIVEERVVILPKLSLLTGAPRCLGGRLSMGMDLPQGKIYISQFDAAVIFVEDAVQDGLGFLTVGTLEIGELDNRNRGLGVALHAGRIESHVDAGWPEHYCDVRFSPQGVSVSLTGLNQ